MNCNQTSNDVEVKIFFFSFLRPLWVEFPDELETFGVEDEYMLGEHFLINYSCDKCCNYVLVITFSSVRTLKNF